MMRPLFILTLLPIAAIAQSAPGGANVPSGEFTKQQLTTFFWAEGANAGDFNKDGKMDIVYGPYWWAGPEYKERHTYADDSKTSKIKKDGAETTIEGFKGALSTENEYSKNFFAYSHDINGDGWTDIVILGFPGEQSWWYENPKGGDGKWVQHVALDVTDNESPHFTDINGDGKPEIVCNSKGYFGYAEFDPKNPNEKWTWHNISPKGGWQRFTHGIGVGDVNGDGKMDIMEAGGWWEQPASLAGDPEWKKHEFKFGGGGSQMYAYDVNGDGKNDIITALAAHGYGIAWFEQTAEGGVEGWTKHVIVGDKPDQNPEGICFSQPHAMDLVDMDGDGIKDLVTGKRFWAHGPSGDNDSNGTPYLYWFKLTREGGVKWSAHQIDDASGVGTQVTARDVNGDGKPDVIVGNKRGAFVFTRK